MGKLAEGLGGATRGDDFPTTGCHQTYVPSLKENIRGISLEREAFLLEERETSPSCFHPMKTGLRDSSAWWAGGGAAHTGAHVVPLQGA